MAVCCLLRVGCCCFWFVVCNLRACFCLAGCLLLVSGFRWLVGCVLVVVVLGGWLSLQRAVFFFNILLLWLPGQLPVVLVVSFRLFRFLVVCWLLRVGFWLWVVNVDYWVLVASRLRSGSWRCQVCFPAPVLAGNQAKGGEDRRRPQGANPKLVIVTCAN